MTHYWTTFTACKSSKKECQMQLDDGYKNGDMIHDAGTLPGDGWRKYTPEETEMFRKRKENGPLGSPTPEVPQG
jgi:hypothetical protein